MSFSDHFSKQASAYATSRPTYPDALWAKLAAMCTRTDAVVDMGAGNGQASIGLATHFNKVFAVEPSDAQRARMRPHRAIQTVAGTASETTLPTGCAQLVVAAQAAHWFDLPRFAEEARRLLQPNGLCALITYSVPEGNRGLTDAVGYCYDKILGPDWPPERAHVDNRYRDLDLPFRPLAFPSMQIEMEWNVERLLNYLRSWSAAARYQTRTGIDPAPAMHEAIAPCFEGDQMRSVCFPVTVVLSRVNDTGHKTGPN